MNAQKFYDKDLKKIDKHGVALDDGKILLYILYEDDPGGAMSYFFDENFKKRRIFNSTVQRWLKEGKAVRADKNGNKKSD